jgi:DNA topoisomerase-3
VLGPRGPGLRLRHLEEQGRQEPAGRRRQGAHRDGRTAKAVTGFKGRSGKSFRARLALQQSEEGKWRVEFDEPWAKEGAKPPEEDAEAAAAAAAAAEGAPDAATAETAAA